MADKKFEKELDRQATLYDAKIRIIDLMANGFELPDTGIYDEPVRYFKANLKWTPIIFGWLSWLEDVAGWPDAEDETYRGIQEILKFEEGIDLTLSEDIANGICEGIECAMENAFKRYLSGDGKNFNVDEDGDLTLGGSDQDAGLPEDDPATAWNDQRAAKYGGSAAVGRAINEYIARLDGLYGTDATPDTPLADAQFTMKMLYIVDATLSDNAIDAYYTYRAAPNGQLGSLGTATFFDHIYCEGYSFESIVEWILDGLAITFAKEQIFIGLIEALGDEFYSNAYNEGILIPSLDYIAAPCEPVAYEELVLDMTSAEAPQKTTNAVHKKAHRLLLEISGSFVDSDVPGDVCDFFYHVTSTGVISYVPSSYQINGAGIIEPAQALVPYQPSHIYAVTVETGLAASGTIVFARDNNPFNLPNVTGSITIKITDLGEYA